MTPKITAISLALTLALAACGNADDDSGAPARTAPTAPPVAAPSAKGTKIVVRGSEFGRMLFNADRQAIYVFENDSTGKSNCHGECARAWPPVLTKGRPVAGKSVRPGLLGTTIRRSGKKQITYAGQPLYYYAHEGPGEVLCHDVFLNGGFWWVVGPDGVRVGA